jgi:trigger factor
MSRPGFVASWTCGSFAVGSNSLVARVQPDVCAASQRRSFQQKTIRMETTVKTERLPMSQVSLEISVGVEETSQAYKNVLRELTTRSAIPGFRKGKAPRQLVINHYGKSNITASACEEVIEIGVKKALEVAGLNAIGQAILDEGEEDIDKVLRAYSPEEPLTFRVKVDVWPEAKINGSYEGLEISAVEVPVDDNVIENALQELRRKESYSVLSPSGSLLEMGKIAVINMDGNFRNEDGTKGDKLPDVAEGDMIEVEMTEGKFVPGMVEGIVGMAVGETREVTVQFPTASARPELSGAKAIFDITVKAIKDTVLPELDDEFARKATESPTLEDLRIVLRERLGLESETATTANVNRAIEDKLAEITEVVLPETMIEERVKTKFAKMLSDFQQKGMAEEQVKSMVTKENYELYKNRARKNVERSLTVNFAITSIAKDHDLAPSAEEVEGQMELIKAELRGEAMEEDKIRDQVEAQFERDNVLAMIKKTAKINYISALEPHIETTEPIAV